MASAGGSIYCKPSLVPKALRGPSISLSIARFSGTSNLRPTTGPARLRAVRRRVSVSATWSPPSEPSISPSTPPEYTPPQEPTGPHRGPAEFNPPETSPTPAVSPEKTPGRPVRPPDIPVPEKDPMKDPDRRRDLADPDLVVPDGE
eukprot:jgi/Botrbrau1/19775/Bobra.0124s0027.1